MPQRLVFLINLNLNKMKFLLPAMLFALIINSNMLLAQVGIGTNTPNSSTVLDVTSTTKGVLLPRLSSTERNAIVNPATGLIIFNTTLNCMEINQGLPATPNWTCMMNSTTSSTSNGTAVISSYTCAGGGMGNMYVGESVSGVTHNLTVNVISTGTYNLSITNNGVTFSGAGTFSSTGSQNILLSASGTPTSLGTHAYQVNATGGCSFSRDVVNSSTNGTAVVSSYSCAAGSAGNLVVGTSATGVTQTITANVTTVGTYSINAIANNIVFNGKGTFTSTGPQNIIMTAGGMPSATGNHTYNLEVGNGCSFSRETKSISSNGTAVFSNVTCGAEGGTLTQGLAAANVTKVLTVDVSVAGTYAISCSQNGVTFSASGTLASTGIQNIVLNASGTPISFGSHSYTLNITPSCTFSTGVGTQALAGSTFSSFSNGTAMFSTNSNCASKLISAGHNSNSCSGTVVTNSATYNMVLINGQCWMKENLKEIPTAPCGDAINTGCNIWLNTTSPTGSGAWGYYNSITTNGTAGWATSEPFSDAGLLYLWISAMNGDTLERAKGVCPNGWHIPSDCEWQYLEHGLGMSVSEQQVSGNRNTGNTGQKLSAFASGGTNSTGFTALLAGRRVSGGAFSELNSSGYFWTSSISTLSSNIPRRYIVSTMTGIGRTNSVRTNNTSSVRCIKD